MERGRKRKPTEIKRLQGTARADRENPKEPKLDVESIKPPSFLSTLAKRYFNELSELLYDMRVVTKADRTAMTLLCDAWAEYRQACEVLRKKGMVYEVEGRNGEQLKTRPEVYIRQNAWTRIRNLLPEFGLTPASRSKVSAIDEQREDPISAFLKKSQQIKN